MPGDGKMEYVVKLMAEFDENSMTKVETSITKKIAALEKKLPPIKIRAVLTGGIGAGEGEAGIAAEITRLQRELDKALNGGGKGGGRGRRESESDRERRIETEANLREKMAATKQAARESVRAQKQEAIAFSRSPEGRRQAQFDRYYMAARVTGQQSHEEATATAFTMVAEAAKKFNDRLKPATEGLDAWGKMFHAIGQGGVRRGVSMGVTEGLGGGALASVVGGFAGTLASSLFLPLAWALGDVIAKMPQVAMDHVITERGLSALGGRTGSNPTGNALLKDTQDLREVFSRAEDPSGKRVRDTIAKIQATYQLTGVSDSDQERERQRNKQWTLIAAAAATGGMGDPIEIAQAAKLMQYGGSISAQQAGLQKLVNNPAFKGVFLSQLHKNMRLPDTPFGWSVAESRLQAKLGMPLESKYGFRASEITNTIADAAMGNARTQGQMATTKGFNRLFGERGFTENVLGTQGNLPANEKMFVDAMQKLYDRKAAGQTRFGGMFGFGTSSFEEMRQFNRSMQYGNNPLGGYGASTYRTIDPKRLDELERIAQGKSNNLDTQPVAQSPTDRSPNFGEYRYQWASFSGLAEQMQMMWSGAPSDAMGEATKNFNVAVNMFGDAVKMMPGAKIPVADRADGVMQTQ